MSREVVDELLFTLEIEDQVIEVGLFDGVGGVGGFRFCTVYLARGRVGCAFEGKRGGVRLGVGLYRYGRALGRHCGADECWTWRAHPSWCHRRADRELRC